MKTVSAIKGHYAFVAMFENGQLAAARFHEPLIIGVGQENIFLSSDVLGFIEYTDNAIYMKSGNFVILENKEFEILDFNGEKVKHEITKVSKEFGDAYKGDYAHFTLKEIYEQPELILKAEERTIEGLEEAVEYIRSAKNIYITGSGTTVSYTHLTLPTKA